MIEWFKKVVNDRVWVILGFIFLFVLFMIIGYYLGLFSGEESTRRAVGEVIVNEVE